VVGATRAPVGILGSSRGARAARGRYGQAVIGTPAKETVGMRVVVTLRRDGDGRVDGQVEVDGEHATRRFSGWMELLRLLDEAAPAVPGTPAPLASDA
jgi:hypothetical protein